MFCSIRCFNLITLFSATIVNPQTNQSYHRKDGSQAQDNRLAQRGERLQTRVNDLTRQLAALPD
jgi:hypothetical protein